MAQRNEDALDRLLRDWSERSEADVDREALAERVSRVADEVRPQPGPESDGSRRKRPALRTIGAIAAALLLAIGLWFARSRPEPAAVPPQDTPAAKLLAQLDADELERRLALLDDLDELFEKRWEWLVESGDRVDVHVGPPEQPANLSDEVAMRLAILVRNDPKEPFRVEKKTFVLTREQEAVETVLKNGSTRKLYFWAFPIDRGLFTYDVDFQEAAPHELSISASGVVAAGRPTKILSFERDGREYRVYLLLVSGRQERATKETHQL